MNAMNEVLIHVDETLDGDSLRALEASIREHAGVVSVGHNPDKAHLIVVVYDSDSTHAASLLRSAQARGLHAQLVGL